MTSAFENFDHYNRHYDASRDNNHFDPYRMGGSEHFRSRGQRQESPIENGMMNFGDPFRSEQSGRRHHDGSPEQPWHQRQHERGERPGHHYRYHSRHHDTPIHRRHNPDEQWGHHVRHHGGREEYPAHHYGRHRESPGHPRGEGEEWQHQPREHRRFGRDDHDPAREISPAQRDAMVAEALKIAGMEPSKQNINAVKRIVQKESSWDPKDTNYTDINARRGHPSTGLMQTIPETFKQFHAPGHGDIHNPIDNMVAGIRYAQHRYGHRGGIHYVSHKRGGY